MTHNNLVVDDIESGAEFAPFHPASHRRPAVYLGFRVPDDDPTDALWAAAQARLAERIGQPDFDTWIKPLRVVDHTGNELRLKVPNESIRAHVRVTIWGLIEDVVKALAGAAVRVAVSVHNAVAERAIDLYCHVQIPRKGRVYPRGRQRPGAAATALAVLERPGVAGRHGRRYHGVADGLWCGDAPGWLGRPAVVTHLARS